MGGVAVTGARVVWVRRAVVGVVAAGAARVVVVVGATVVAGVVVVLVVGRGAGASSLTAPVADRTRSGAGPASPHAAPRSRTRGTAHRRRAPMSGMSTATVAHLSHVCWYSVAAMPQPRLQKAKITPSARSSPVSSQATWPR
jgi:hypothetical protein